MRRILALCVAMVACSAFGQGPADVPANHWASKAVTDLYQLGILKGFPDGQYRGTRPVTRYELAQAINGLNQEQVRLLGGLTEQLTTLTATVKERQANQVDVQGLADMRKRLDALEGEMPAMQTMRSDVTELTTRFETMLADLRKLRETVRANMRKPRQ